MVALSLDAMGTRFELVVYGDDPARLRGGGEQALEEIARVERQLSFYRPESEISWLNTRAADGHVQVDPRLFRLLADCARLTEATGGAFDVTVGPLVRAWGFAGGERAVPEPGVLAAARECVGMANVALDEASFTVRYLRRGVEIDLGGYGKGYAIERAVELLRESGVERALVHGGTSSVYGIGAPPDETAWKIGLAAPLAVDGEPKVVELRDAGLSVSAARGKHFSVDGRTYGHVLDPRRGEPVAGEPAAAVVGPLPAVCEALSTALVVNGASWLGEMASRFPGYTGVCPA
jgi:thiamine biosynthesis lipoprotein